MNPNNGQVPLDYLNQIATSVPTQPRFSWNLRTIIMAGVAVIILVIILAVTAGAISSAQQKPWLQYAVKLSATATIVDSASGFIKNSQLRSLNSEVKIYITNAQRDFAAPLKKRGIDSTKLPADALKIETSSGMADRLENGRLNAKYDSTYAREMGYQLATMLSLLQRMYAAGGSAETKQTLTAAYDNLKPIYDGISKFSASNE